MESGGISIWQIVIVFVLYSLPAIFVLFSSRVKGWKKVGWVVVSLWFWFIGYILFLLITKKPENPNN
jgi:hypothetical protein